MPKRRLKPMDVAKCFIEKNMDREGVAKHFINPYIGKKVSYDMTIQVFILVLVFIKCQQFSTNVYDRLMYGVWS